MPKQHHEILIHAPREHVWRSTLFSPSYEHWTATFTDEAGGTRLRVDVDVFGTYDDWMNEAWPKALLALKTVCETPA